MIAEAVAINKIARVRNRTLEFIGGKSQETKIVTENKVRLNLSASQAFLSCRSYKSHTAAHAAAKRINKKWMNRPKDSG